MYGALRKTLLKMAVFDQSKSEARKHKCHGNLETIKWIQRSNNFTPQKIGLRLILQFIFNELTYKKIFKYYKAVTDVALEISFKTNKKDLDDSV